MNCAQARRALSLSPQQIPPDVGQHIAGCSQCSLFATAQSRGDEMLRAAFESTRSPGMLERLSLQHAMAQRRRRMFLGAAASVALGTVGGALFWPRSQQMSTEHWALAMRDHVLEDPLHLLPPDPKAPAQWKAAFASIGIVPLAPLPTILRASACQLMGYQAAHLVFEVVGQRAVAFLLGALTGPTTIVTEGLQGELRSLVGGSVGVFAKDMGTVRTLADIMVSCLRLDKRSATI